MRFRLSFITSASENPARKWDAIPLKKKLNTFQATFSEVTRAKAIGLGGLIGVNIMSFLQIDRDAAAMGAMAAGADFIFTGAGSPERHRLAPLKGGQSGFPAPKGAGDFALFLRA